MIPSGQSPVEAEMRRIFGGASRRTGEVPDMAPSPSGRRPLGAISGNRKAGVAVAASLLLAIGGVGGLLLTPTRLVISPPGGQAAERPQRQPQPVRSMPTPPPVEVVADRGDDPLSADPAIDDQDIVERPEIEVDVAAPQPRPISRPQTSQRPAQTAPAPVGCGDGPGRDQCLFEQVSAADERLRRAYRSARAAGVPVGEMAEVRRQWKRALDGSLDDPKATVERYGQLTVRLEDARREEEWTDPE